MMRLRTTKGEKKQPIEQHFICVVKDMMWILNSAINSLFLPGDASLCRDLAQKFIYNKYSAVKKMQGDRMEREELDPFVSLFFIVMLLLLMIILTTGLLL